MNKEEIRHFKALLRQGILRHRSVLLDVKFQSELLNIIKGYEQLEQQCQKQQEVIIKAVLELVNIDGNLSNSQLSDRICNLIDILKEVSE